MSKVFVGMSGGVDSSVSAKLLVDQGHEVTGVYMKNWSEDLPGMRCPWAEDLADAKRVAVRLGIDFEVWDFEQDYREKVVEYMLAEFRAGRTPNPDIMCNEEIKFKLFYERAMRAGADYIATGHYARNLDGKLGRARDENKDQTYFLYRISNEAMARTLFPLGEMLKPEVKELAAAAGLPNAYKKESMGVCFVGEVGMRDFLQHYIEAEPGEIREIETEKVLGAHEGAIFYTIGQRHGLYLSGVTGEVNSGLPYYVVAKDLGRNIVYVSQNLNHPALWTEELELRDVVWRGGGLKSGQGERLSQENRKGDKSADDALEEVAETKKKTKTGLETKNEAQDVVKFATPREVLVRVRHRGELIPATFDGRKVKFSQAIRRPASGQSAVFYDERFCLGGGIIG